MGINFIYLSLLVQAQFCSSHEFKIHTIIVDMELYHAPRFRSTRVIILYKELLHAYSSESSAEDNEDNIIKNDSKAGTKTQPTLSFMQYHHVISQNCIDCSKLVTSI